MPSDTTITVRFSAPLPVAAPDGPRTKTSHAEAASATIPTSASSPDGQRRDAGWATISSISCVVAASVRITPCGVRSKAHARATASGKPSSARTVTPVRKASGSRSASCRTSAAWTMTNAVAPYTAATRNTWRRFSSAKNLW